jgi:hypothetical protein
MRPATSVVELGFIVAEIDLHIAMTETRDDRTS